MRTIIWLGILLNSTLAWSQNVVELQWAICGADPSDVVDRARGTALEKKSSMLTFFDAKDGYYTSKGISLRTEEKKKKIISQVKIRRVSDHNTADAASNCEFDQYGNNLFFACKIAAEIKDLDSPWSEEQKDFIDREIPVRWGELEKFGPFAVEKREFEVNSESFTVDSIKISKHKNLTELSIRVARDEARLRYSEFTELWKNRGIPLCTKQRGKIERFFDPD